jgi:putative spermidine/putrescine transport system permease protein
VVALVVVLLTAPTLIVVVSSFGATRALSFPPKGFSFEWYRTFFGDPWLPTAITSLKVACLATILATALGTMGALSVVRGKLAGRQLIQIVFLAPMVVPTVIFGVGAFQVASQWHLTSTLSMVLAHTVLGLPFVFVTVGAALQTVDPVYERAARSLGAGPVKTFVRITMPLILPGVLTGAVFAFVTSLDEVVVAIFLTSPTVTTLPVQMWSTLQNSLDPTVAAISTMLLAVTLVVIASSSGLRRRSGAGRIVPAAQGSASENPGGA